MGVRRLRHQGVTLIELIIAIVVLGIAAVGILTALGRTTVLNVDPMLRAQGLALAQSFMDEVSSKPFYAPSEDPRFDENAGANPCPGTDLNSLSSRVADLDHVCAYADYNATQHEGGLTAPDGDPVVGLSGYNVRVTVTSNADEPFSAPFDGLAPDCMLRVEVIASAPAGADTRLVSYRSSLWEGCS
ncbi:type II secretion system protein [Natronospirillum operosum]|uniref:Type II secretion system protein n=1 Tax=Natronospirillum operosum TaxID=2759953 RepID=A0A4Z0WC02_9GAMM|nr:prepilin-type N-terminal cleavage/methylation domain-containing protein [Natronospirillum operosum]TGG92339.1 type II secretion system protein [Natronospirillum operosum]